MIIDNELYDIGYALTLIRNNIKASENMLIIKKIIDAISDQEKTMQTNNIRNELSSIIDSHNSSWKFVFINNYYTKPLKIIKNILVNQCLIESLNSLLELLSDCQYEQAYDLADILHVMTEIMAEFKGAITKSFWKGTIAKYRKKWNNDFLIKYQKELITKG